MENIQKRDELQTTSSHGFTKYYLVNKNDGATAFWKSFIP